MFWGWHLLVYIEFHGRTLLDCPSAMASSTSAAAPTPAGVAPGACYETSDLQSALSLTFNPNGNGPLDGAWLDVIVLVGMILVLRLAAYYVLRRKTAAARLGK